MCKSNAILTTTSEFALAAFLSWQFNSKCIDTHSVLTNILIEKIMKQ